MPQRKRSMFPEDERLDSQHRGTVPEKIPRTVFFRLAMEAKHRAWSGALGDALRSSCEAVAEIRVENAMVIKPAPTKSSRSASTPMGIVPLNKIMAFDPVRDVPHFPIIAIVISVAESSQVSQLIPRTGPPFESPNG